MSPEERAHRGERAANLMDNLVFKEVTDACLRLIQSRWASSKETDAEGREMLFHQHQAIHQIEEMLNNFIEDGHRAEKELNGD